jgi:hypothetical protein
MIRSSMASFWDEKIEVFSVEGPIKLFTWEEYRRV